MNQIAPAPTDRRNEATERAAWLARLAFGDATTCTAHDAGTTNETVRFEVLP